jgi:hypothetical protein
MDDFLRLPSCCCALVALLPGPEQAAGDFAAQLKSRGRRNSKAAAPQ